jgi:hypothetical protein
VLGGLIELVDSAVDVRVQTPVERLVELFFNRLVEPLSYRCLEIVLALVCRTKDLTELRQQYTSIRALLTRGFRAFLRREVGLGVEQNVSIHAASYAASY